MGKFKRKPIALLILIAFLSTNIFPIPAMASENYFSDDNPVLGLDYGLKGDKKPQPKPQPQTQAKAKDKEEAPKEKVVTIHSDLENFKFDKKDPYRILGFADDILKEFKDTKKKVELPTLEDPGATLTIDKDAFKDSLIISVSYPEGQKVKVEDGAFYGNPTDEKELLPEEQPTETKDQTKESEKTKETKDKNQEEATPDKTEETEKTGLDELKEQEEKEDLESLKSELSTQAKTITTDVKSIIENTELEISDEPTEPQLAPVRGGNDWVPSDFTFDGNTVTGFSDSGKTKVQTNKDLVIPSVTTSGSEVNSIGKNAFEGKQLTTVEIPSSVVLIDESAFYTNNLTSVKIPNRVTKICNWAFCSNKLTSVTIPDSVTSIGSVAFRNNQLTALKIPKSVKEIGNEAFNYNKLTSVVIPNSVTSIGNGAFKNNQLTNVEIPNSITKIEWDTFSNNQLTQVEIPNSVTLIGSWAFKNNRLTSVEIPNSLTEIRDGAFKDNQLTSVVIPNSVKSIGGSAFSNNPNTFYPKPVELRVSTDYPYQTVDAEDRKWVKVSYEFLPEDFTYDGGTITGFSATGKEKVKVNKDLVIPSKSPGGEKVTLIGKFAFDENQLNSVEIPNTVTIIGPQAFARNQLSQVILPSSLIEIKQNAFENNKLTSVTIPNSVTTIDTSAFSHNNLTIVEIPNSVAKIGVAAFQLNPPTNPKKVELHVSYDYPYPTDSDIDRVWVKASPEFTLDDFTYDKNTVTGFSETGKEKIKINKNLKLPAESPKGRRVVRIGPRAFKGYGIESIDLTGTRIRTFGDECFSNNNISGDLIIGSSTLGDHIEIGNRAFMGNNITKLSIKTNSWYQISLGEMSFYDNNLTELNLDSEYTEIGTGAFSSYRDEPGWRGKNPGNQIISINLSSKSGIPVIGDYAFYNNKVDAIKKDGVDTCDFSAYKRILGKYSFYGNNLSKLKLLGRDEISLQEGVFENNNISEIEVVVGEGSLNKFEIGPRALAGNKLTEFPKTGNLRLRNFTSPAISDSAFIDNPNGPNDYPKTPVKIKLSGRYIRAIMNNLKDVITPEGGHIYEYDGKPGVDPNTWQASHFTFDQAGTTITGLTDAGIQFLETHKDMVLPQMGPTSKSITKIGPRAFKDKKINTVVFPNGLKVIDNEAFRDSGLTSITLPDSLEQINYRAFTSNNLKEFKAPISLKSIKGDAFRANNNLTSVDLGSVKEIGKQAFAVCAIENLFVPKSVESIGESAFFTNDIKTLQFESGSALASIGSKAFQNNGIKELTLPDSITKIGFNAFEDNQISELTLPTKLETIEDFAFTNNQLSEVTIPTTLKTIGANSFSSNGQVVDLHTPKYNNPNNLKDSIIAPDSGHRILTKANAKDANWTEKDFVYDDEFHNILGLSLSGQKKLKAGNKDIVIPVTDKTGGILGHKSGGTYFIGDFGEYTYTLSDCINAEGMASMDDILPFNKLGTVNSITFGEPGNKVYSNRGISKNAFSGTKISKLETNVPNLTIFDSAFSGCNLSTVKFNKNVKKLGNFAFSSNNLTSVAFNQDNEKVEIGKYAFAYNKLSKLELPAEATVENSTFFYNKPNGNTATPVLLSPAKGTTFSSIVTHTEDGKGGHIVQDVADITVTDDQFVYRDIDANTTEIAGFAKGMETVLNGNTNFKLIVPDTHNGKKVISIAKNAFKDAKGVSEVDFSKATGIQIIGESAFENCNLRYVTLPESLVEIEKLAFFNNNLSSINLPPSVATVGDYAFGKNAISKIEGTVGITDLGVGVFHHNKLTGTLYLGRTRHDDFLFPKLTKIPDQTFMDNELEEIFFIGIKEVGNDAFKGNKIDKLDGYEGLTKIGDRAFKSNKIPPKDRDDKSWKLYWFPNLTYLGKDVFAENGNNIYISANSQFVTGQKYSDGYRLVVNPMLVTFQFVDTNGNKIAGDQQAEEYQEGVEETYKPPIFDGYRPVKNEIKFTPRKDGKPCVVVVEYESVKNLPTINSKDIVLPQGKYKVGDTIPKDILLKDVTAKDFEGTDLTSSIEVVPESVQLISEGTYPITYKVTDIYGNTATVSNKVIFSNNLKDLPVDSNWYHSDFTYIGNSVTGLSDKGKTKAKTVKTITMPSVNPDTGEPITTIAHRAFFNYDFEKVNIPNGITEIRTGAFEGNMLTQVDIPDTVTTIGKGAFYDNLLTSVKLSNSLETIGEGAFAGYIETPGWGGKNGGNDIEDLVLPPSLRVIGPKAFMSNSIGGNSRHYELKIPEGVEEIGESAFCDNRHIRSVSLPKTLKSVGINAFAENRIRTAIVPEGIASKDGMKGAYNKNPINKIIRLADVDCSTIGDSNKKILRTVVIGGNSTEVFEDEFYKCGIRDLEFLSDSKVKTIGYRAFSNNQLISATIPNSVTSIGMVAFDSNQLTSVTIPNSVTSIGTGAFGNNQLTSVTIPRSVTKIYDYVFYNNKLTSVTIPNSVTLIAHHAFFNNQLTSLEIPNSVASIGASAFENNQLTSVEIPNSVTTIGNSAFSNNRLTTVTIPNSVTKLSEGVFYYNDLTSITIPNSVTSIEKDAFNANQLTSVTIPNSVISIGESVFCNNQLTTIKIPNSVTSIGDYAFSQNQLTSVEIPNSVTSIGKSSFEDNKLTTVEIPNRITTIPSNAFSFNKLTSVEIPNSVTSINMNAFQNNQLASVTIPNSVKTIGSSAFSSNQLTTVTIPNSVTSIEEDSFQGNPGYNSKEKVGLILEDPTNPNNLTDSRNHVLNTRKVEISYLDNLTLKPIKEKYVEYMLPNDPKTYTPETIDGYKSVNPSEQYTINKPGENPEQYKVWKHEFKYIPLGNTPITVNYLDSETDTPLLDQVVIKKVNGEEVTINPPKIDGYKEPKPVKFIVSGPKTIDFKYTKLTPESYKAELNTYIKKGFPNKVNVKDEMITYVHFAFNGTLTPDKSIIQVKFDDLVDMNTVKVGEFNSLVSKKIDKDKKILELDVTGAPRSTSLDFPVSFKMKVGPTPQNYVTKPVATFIADGQEVITNNDAELISTYNDPGAYISADGSTRDGSRNIGEVDKSGKFITDKDPTVTYRFFRDTPMERDIGSVKITNPLPMYRKYDPVDGTISNATAVFDSAKNPGWRLEGNTAIYDGPLTPTPELKLDFPFMAVYKDVTNKATVEFTPVNPVNGEKMQPRNVSITVYAQGAEATGNFMSKHPNVDYIYDGLKDKNREFYWSIYVRKDDQNKTNPYVFEDYNLDSRMYYTGISLDSAMVGSIIKTLDKDRNVLEELQPNNPSKVEFNSSTAKLIKYVIVESPTNIRNAANFRIYTKIRNPKEPLYSKSNSTSNWMPNSVKARVGNLSGNYTDSIGIRSLDADAWSTISHTLGSDAILNGASGTITVGNVSHFKEDKEHTYSSDSLFTDNIGKYTDYKQVVLIPKIFSVDEVIPSAAAEKESGFKYDIKPNYNSNGDTAVIFKADTAPSTSSYASIKVSTKVGYPSGDYTVKNYAGWSNDSVNKRNPSNDIDGKTMAYSYAPFKLAASSEYAPVKEISTDGKDWKRSIKFAGGEFYYRLRMVNSSVDVRSDLSIKDTLPKVNDGRGSQEQVKFISTVSKTPGYNVSESGGVVTFKSDAGKQIKPGESAEAIIKVSAPKATLENNEHEMLNDFKWTDSMQKTALTSGVVKATLSLENKKLKVIKYDKDTNKVIPGTILGVFNKHDIVVKTGTTDENGVIEFELDPKFKEYGYYVREIEAVDGYVLDETHHPVTDNNEMRIANSPVPKPPTPPVGSIKFVKVGNDGKPISDVEFKLQGAEQATNHVSKTLRSDARGNVLFEKLPLGKYTLSETKKGLLNPIEDRTVEVKNRDEVVDLGNIVNDTFDIKLLKIGLPYGDDGKPYYSYEHKDGVKLAAKFDLYKKDESGDFVFDRKIGWSGSEIKGLKTNTVYKLVETLDPNLPYEDIKEDFLFKVDNNGKLLTPDNKDFVTKSVLVYPNIEKPFVQISKLSVDPKKVYSKNGEPLEVSNLDYKDGTKLEGSQFAITAPGQEDIHVNLTNDSEAKIYGVKEGIVYKVVETDVPTGHGKFVPTYFKLEDGITYYGTDKDNLKEIQDVKRDYNMYIGNAKVGVSKYLNIAGNYWIAPIKALVAAASSGDGFNLFDEDNYSEAVAGEFGLSGTTSFNSQYNHTIFYPNPKLPEINLFKLGVKPELMDKGSKSYKPIHKIGPQDGKNISGAEFLFNGLTRLTVDGSGKVTLPVDKLGQWYTVKETKAPTNYVGSTEELKFYLNFDGSISAENGENFVIDKTIFFPNSITAELKVNKIGVVQEPTKKILDLTDKDGVALTGAEFSIYDVDGNKVEANITNIPGGTISIKNIQYNTWYYLREDKAPDGYIKGNDFKFKINENNRVVDSDGNVDGADNIIYYPNVKKGITHEININKIDENGNTIGGSSAVASFTIYKKDPSGNYIEYSKINTNGRSIRSGKKPDGKPRYIFTNIVDFNGGSTASEAARARLSSPVPQGKAKFMNVPSGEYKLVETEAPEGYIKSNKEEVFVLPNSGQSLNKQFNIVNKKLKVKIFKYGIIKDNMSKDDADKLVKYLSDRGQENVSVRPDKQNKNYMVVEPLQGAEFSHGRANYTTNTKGGTLISDVSTNSDGLIEITETKAPEGYTTKGTDVIKIDPTYYTSQKNFDGTINVEVPNRRLYRSLTLVLRDINKSTYIKGAELQLIAKDKETGEKIKVEGPKTTNELGQIVYNVDTFNTLLPKPSDQYEFSVKQISTPKPFKVNDEMDKTKIYVDADMPNQLQTLYNDYEWYHIPDAGQKGITIALIAGLLILLVSGVTLFRRKQTK